MKWIRFYMRFRSYYDASKYHIPQYFHIKFYPEIVYYSKEEIITLSNEVVKQIRGFRWIIEGEIQQLSSSENLLPFLLSNQKLHIDLFSITPIFSRCSGLTIVPIFHSMPCILELDYERTSRISIHNLKFKMKSNLYEPITHTFSLQNYYQFWFRILKCEVEERIVKELHFISLLSNEIVVNGFTGHIIRFYGPESLPETFEIYNKNYPTLYLALDREKSIQLAFPITAPVFDETDPEVAEYYFEKIDSILRRPEI